MLSLLNIFQHMYPDTNMHELDLTWILREVEEFDKQLDDLEERVTQKAIEASKEYIDVEMASIRADFAELQQNVSNLNILFTEKVAEIESEFDTFTYNIQNQIILLNNRITSFEERVQQEIIGINATTDEKIALNNEYLLEQVSQGLANIKVLNYFTGELTPVQDMFDYLAQFHLENPITYTELAGANITYTAYTALNMTYTELAVKGKSFIIP